MATLSKTHSGANGVVADPRQQYFLAYYLDPKSETFSNALQSALKAGYAQNYAENIMDEMPDWLREKLGKIKSSVLLEKAERNLDELLDLPSKTQAMGPFGPLYEGKGKNKKPIMGYATGLIKVKNDVSQFVAERVGKSIYAKDTEDNSHKILIINISGESTKRYGINTITSDNSSRPA